MNEVYELIDCDVLIGESVCVIVIAALISFFHLASYPSLPKPRFLEYISPTSLTSPCLERPLLSLTQFHKQSVRSLQKTFHAMSG